MSGNHGFYRHNYQSLLKQFCDEAELYKIHFLENKEVVLNGIRFLGCTLWTDYQNSKGMTQEEAMDSLEYRLTDHCLIN